MANGQVNINILDNGGSIVVPQNETQLLLGCSSAGTSNLVVACTLPSQVVANFGYGPLTEAAALICVAGGVALCVKTTQNTTGTALAVIPGGSNTSTSAVTLTLDGTVGAFDDYYILLTIVVGGTVGTGPITFTLSLDAGRNTGPVLGVTTATTFVIPNTGVTLNFGAGALASGDTFFVGTAAPSFTASGVQTALTAFQATQYATQGVGSMQLVGAASSTAGTQHGLSGANATTVSGYLETLANGYIFNRIIASARDAAQPTAWGGAGETEATWMASLSSDFAGVGSTASKRICVSAGYYNMPTAIPTQYCGTPFYRRPLSFALAAREVAINPQTHAGRVSDGSLSNIVINPSKDPQDGFIYHDERLSPGLDAARFASAWTRVKLTGFYIDNPNLMSPPGSQFTILPIGNVMDIACDIVLEVGQQFLDDDIQLTPINTISQRDAISIQNAVLSALKAQMFNTAMISQVPTVVVDQTNNVAATGNVNISVTITSRGYILQETVNIQFQSPFVA